MAPKDFNPDYLVPGTRIGAYVVRTMLGQGGSSSVYEVESAGERRFALKMCRYHGGAPHGTSEWRVDQRFSRSIIGLQLLKGLRNVAEMYAHGRHPDPLRGYQYVVQELVPDSLLITDWVKRESPTLRKLVGGFVELAGLCSVMASKGICHRDLKPANILVAPGGTPKVIDFESATCPHAEPVTRREASAVPGTGGWQSPELCLAILEEQSRKKSKEAFHFLPWGDLFSLGVVFYECLTGEHPFDTSLPEDMLLAEVAFEKPIHPVRLTTAVPLGLNKVVMKLLEKQPEARYHDGAEVAEDLRRLLEKVKDERWDRPFELPTPDDEEAPVLPLISALVPPQTPPEATSSPRPARQDATSTEADTDGVLSGESKTTEPGEPPKSTGEDLDTPRVLDLGDAGVYTLEERLGRGGYGEVYRARQVGAAGFEQWVAIKRLYPGCRPSEARSFLDEARVLSRLHHENIPRVYAFHEWQGSYYLVMEYIEGHSLHALLEVARRKGHRFSESVACAVMAQVADALHHAHHATDEAGRPLHIVHRDVSPTNILITRAGRVVLVDFGVAFSRHEGREATRPSSTSLKGKVPYLSPEQVMHLPLDARSDQFSVGTILVEMLTGEAPFGWTADSVTLKCIAEVTPEYVASLLPGVSRPLRALCQKLLAPHPDQRFATELEVAMALRRHAGLGEVQQCIQAELERLHALPDTEDPPAAAVAGARSRSRVKRAGRAVALAAAAMLVTLAFASWYVPRNAAAPVPSSPPLQGPAMSLQRAPEKTLAPALPVPTPNGPLVGEPKREDGATAVAAGPAHRRKVVSPPSDPATGEHSASRQDDRGSAPPTVTARPSGGRTSGAVQVDEDAYRAVRSALDDALSRERALREENARLKAVNRSADLSLAAFLMNGVMKYVSFRSITTERLKDGGLDVEIELLSAPGKAATVITLTNGRGNPPWKFGEARVSRDLSSLTAVPFSFTTDRDEIGPGETGKIAVVVDDKAFASAQGLADLAVQIFRDDGVEELLVNLDHALVRR